MIGDDVEIGAGTTIDRSTLETTRIGCGTKIDNLVTSATMSIIGRKLYLICGMVGVFGQRHDRRPGAHRRRRRHQRPCAGRREAVIGPGSGVPSNVDAGAFVRRLSGDVARTRHGDVFGAETAQAGAREGLRDGVALDTLEQLTKK